MILGDRWLTFKLQHNFTVCVTVAYHHILGLSTFHNSYWFPRRKNRHGHCWSVHHWRWHSWCPRRSSARPWTYQETSKFSKFKFLEIGHVYIAWMSSCIMYVSRAQGYVESTQFVLPELLWWVSHGSSYHFSAYAEWIQPHRAYVVNHTMNPLYKSCDQNQIQLRWVYHIS